ncbi:MAG: hypothetical protein H7835_20640, partial [Magnetococcus sp. XQGC-1]
VGMDGYLRKPYRSSDLLNIIDKIVLQRRHNVHKSPIKQQNSVLKEVGLDPVVLSEKGAAFIQSLPVYLEELNRAISKENHAQIGKWVDRLSEAARGIGAWKVPIQGVRLRSSAEQKNWEEVHVALAKLSDNCHEAKQALMDKDA